MDKRYDMVLSYTFSHGDTHERRILDELLAHLDRAGIRAFLIPEDAQYGKNWGRRYYEGAFHSIFLVPVLSRAYLSRPGTQEEMKAMAVLVGDRMHSTFFCPIIPVVPSVDYLRSESLARAGANEAGSFSWLKTHAFPVVLEWGPEKVGRFFKSLVAGARGNPNLDCLRVIAGGIRAVEFAERFGRPTARVQIDNPTFEDRYEFHVGKGGIRFAGCIKDPPAAVKSLDTTTIVDIIEHHVLSPREGTVLECEDCRARRSPETGGSACSLCSKPMTQINVVPHAPEKREMLTCESCGTWGHPVSYEVGAECGECGGQMSEMAPHEVVRLLSNRYGRREE